MVKEYRKKKIAPPQKGFLAPKMGFFAPDMGFKSIIYFKTLCKVRKLVKYTKYDVLSSRNAKKKKNGRKNGFLAPKTGFLAPEMGFKSII